MKKRRPKIQSTHIEVGKTTPEQEEIAAQQLAELFSPNSVLVTRSGREYRGQHQNTKLRQLIEGNEDGTITIDIGTSYLKGVGNALPLKDIASLYVEYSDRYGKLNDRQQNIFRDYFKYSLIKVSQEGGNSK